MLRKESDQYSQNSFGLWRVTLAILTTLTTSTCVTTSEISSENSRKSAFTQHSHYDIYLSGSGIDTTPSPKGGIILVGGGSGCDDAFVWFTRQAAYGDIVVIRASGADGYNEPLIRMGAKNVSSIVIKSREASQDLKLLTMVKNAEGIFFAGGDQSKYTKFLAETPLASEINKAAERGVPIGGSSAGLAILGEFYFPAHKDTITSDQTLADPYDHRLILEKRLLRLPHLNNLITDSHFRNRDRMGRLITFMARLLTDKWSRQVRGVGLDENVAIGIDANGIGEVFADSGHAYLLEAKSRPNSCSKSTPLTFDSVTVRKLPGDTKFDFKNWDDTKTRSYTLRVEYHRLPIERKAEA